MEKKNLKIACISICDLLNRQSLSGSGFYILHTLKKKYAQVDVIGNHIPYLQRPLLLFLHIIHKITGKGLYWHLHWVFSFWYCHNINKVLKKGNYDAVICTFAFPLLRHLKTNLPVIYISDCPHSAFYNYYNLWSSCFKPYDDFVNNSEKKALANASAAAWSSRWAADLAIKDYGYAENKSLVVPLGPNIDTSLPRETVLSHRKTGAVCKLFSLGVAWERKGGPIIYKTLQALKKRGFPVHLTVCGFGDLDEHYHDDCMTIIPFLNKNIPEQANQINQLFLDSHFFFLPSQAEAFGFVFCEASAMALPSIATRTGGIPIEDGVNGYALPFEAQPEAYADLIQEIYSDETRYRKLCQSSRDLYETKLNWDAWAEGIDAILEKLRNNP